MSSPGGQNSATGGKSAAISPGGGGGGGSPARAVVVTRIRPGLNSPGSTGLICPVPGGGSGGVRAATATIPTGSLVHLRGPASLAAGTKVNVVGTVANSGNGTAKVLKLTPQQLQGKLKKKYSERTCKRHLRLTVEY